MHNIILYSFAALAIILTIIVTYAFVLVMIRNHRADKLRQEYGARIIEADPYAKTERMTK